MNILSVDRSEAFQTVRLNTPRLDAARTPAFRQASGALTDGPGRLLLDLSDVEFIDSTGLGGVVSLLKSLGPSGEIWVVGARPPVRRLFELTRLDRVFQLFATLEDAQAAAAT